MWIVLPLQYDRPNASNEPIKVQEENFKEYYF